MKSYVFKRAWIITQVDDEGKAVAVRKTSTYYANLDAALGAHGHNFLKWADDTIETEVPEDEVPRVGGPF